MKFVFLGDVHGNFLHCENVCKQHTDSTIVQVGDLNVGFIRNTYLLENLPSNFKFFVGNHDNRQLANTLPHCLGDYGEAFGGKFFFVSGAYSIDRAGRTEGVNWWNDEELTYKQANHCLELWEISKCDVLISHDIPQSFAESYQLIYDTTITRNLLQAMIEVRKPKLVVSGHHHKSKDLVTHQGIHWKSLGIDETFSLDI